MAEGLLISFVALLLAIATAFAEGKPSILLPNLLVSQSLGDRDHSITTAPLPVTSKNGTLDQAEQFDGFISYRRIPSRNLAMLLKVLLQRENLTVYLDVEDLGGGGWEKQLMNGIADSPNFILVLGNGTLDRAKGDDNYQDTMHKEIREAVCANKRIILVFDDFNFPPATDFSEEIQAALESQGLTWQHSLVDQSLEDLISYIREPVPLNSDHQSKLPSRQARLEKSCAAASNLIGF